MRMIRQLEQMLDSIPFWGQIAIAIALVAFSCISVYGRINVDFGMKVFSRVPREQIRSNKGHIFQYTVVPVLVTIGYLWILSTLHMS